MPAKRKRAAPQTATAPGTSHEQDVRWVMSSLSSGAREQDAPSTAAWSMYEIASTDEKSKQAFLDKIYSKLINREKPTEGGKAFADDKRKFFALFGALEIEKPELLNDNFPRTPVVSVEPPASDNTVAVESPIGPATVLPSADGGATEAQAPVGCAVG